jgi:hypothetical protein
MLKIGREISAIFLDKFELEQYDQFPRDGSFLEDKIAQDKTDEITIY